MDHADHHGGIRRRRADGDRARSQAARIAAEVFVCLMRLHRVGAYDIATRCQTRLITRHAGSDAAITTPPGAESNGPAHAGERGQPSPSRFDWRTGAAAAISSTRRSEVLRRVMSGKGG